MKKLMKKAGLALGAVAGATLALPQQVAAYSLNSMLSPKNAIGGITKPDQLVSSIVNIVFIVGIALVFFYLIFGAVSWITSGGDKGKVEAARNKITAAVIGMLILASVWAVFSLLMSVFFNSTSLDQAIKFFD